MANYQLGPESPRPFSVISEGHVRRRVDLPYIPEHERYSFGDAYERRLCELIHKHLELDTNDRLCYVGEQKGSLSSLIQTKFCVIEPITTVVPGHVHYEESPNHRMLPIKVPNVGAEEYFRKLVAQQKEGVPLYDKVFLRDAVDFFEDSKETFQNIMRTVSEFGRLLIIERPAPMNTLPIFRDALERLTEKEAPYVNTIKNLQSCKFDVQWEIECLPIVTTKSKWYSMIKEKYPPQMEIVSNVEVASGLRELSEGVLKYSSDELEFVDRLLFITVTRPLLNDTLPCIQRFGFPSHAVEPLAKPQELGMKYQMAVTPDMNKYIRHSDKEKPRK